MMIRAIHNSQGELLQSYTADTSPVLDPRVAYVMTSMMEGVVNTGTGFIVRQMGFTAPAAGKTGTSHDAWFAGYTSNLLCIVWVGLDDYSDIRLSGTAAAAPIWAEFMKRAQRLRQYQDMKGFSQPSGVVQVELDKVTNELATPSCPETYTAAFIAGTEPKQTCDQAIGDHRGFFSKIFGGNGQQTVLPPPTSNGPVANMPPAQTTTATQQQQQQQEKKKKGFFGKIAGFFKSDATEGQDASDDNKPSNANSKPK
jgi:penicillin-binding protein 1B